MLRECVDCCQPALDGEQFCADCYRPDEFVALESEEEEEEDSWLERCADCDQPALDGEQFCADCYRHDEFSILESEAYVHTEWICAGVIDWQEATEELSVSVPLL